MAFNLLDAAKNLLPNDLISKAAVSLGESEGGVQKALSAAVPSVFAGLLSKSSGSGGGSGILDMVKGAAGGGILNNLSGLLTGGSGMNTVMGWLRSLFGDKTNNVTNAISGFAGIKSSSANTVLGLAAPAVLGSIGKYATENNLSEPDVVSLLQSQKSSILNAIPSGFNLTGVLGISSLTDMGSKVTDKVSYATETGRDTEATEPTTGNKWLWPLLLLLGIGALVWLFSQRGCKNAETPAAVEDTTTTTIAPPMIETPRVSGRLDTVTGNYIYDIGNEIELKLADGTVMRVGDNSTEAKLFNMLSSSSFVIDETDKTNNWVTFDRVYFETSKSVLTAESQTQVKNVATILKNFPLGAIKIGGYTDNTGDAAGNQKLSDERAKVVSKELANQGAGSKQVSEAVGYGAEHPVCPTNDTPECKAQNRRVDLKVSAK